MRNIFKRFSKADHDSGARYRAWQERRVCSKAELHCASYLFGNRILERLELEEKTLLLRAILAG